MKSKRVDEIFNRNSMQLFLMVMCYFLLVLVSYCFFQIIHLKNCLGLTQTISFSIPIILFFIKKSNLKKSLINKGIILFLYLLIIMGTPFIMGKTFDLTIDGNSYHKTAIAFIKNGWNPIYEKAFDFQNNNAGVVQFTAESRIDLWVEHYPKASWILAANYYNITNNIESGKCITLILVLMMCILSYNVFTLFLNKKISFIISLLLALNPIILCQIFNYYIDGIMGICFIIEILLLSMIEFKKKQSLELWLGLGAVLAIFVNLKFTGLLYSGIIAAVFYFYWLIKNRKEKNFLKLFRNVTILFTIVFSVAIFFVGSNSYVLNTIQHHNPLYPLIGKDKVDIITTMQPAIFNEIASPQKFFWSLFSKTENVTYVSGEKPELKYPFMVYQEEIEGLNIPDLRIAGFGPLFALTIIISLVIYIVCIIKLIKNDKKPFKYIGLFALILFLTILLVGEGWWARYVPQLYFVPICALLILGYTQKYFNKKVINYIMGGILILVLLINSGFFMKVDYDNLVIHKQVREDITMMQSMDEVVIENLNSDLVGFYYNLRDCNVRYKVVDYVEDANSRYVYNWRFKMKVN